jgi:hypothetical protein
VTTSDQLRRGSTRRRYAQVPEALLFDPEYSSHAKTVWGILDRHIDNRAGSVGTETEGVAFPARKTLAGYMGVSLDTVDRALAELRLGGWLTTTHRGQGRTALNELFDEPDAARARLQETARVRRQEAARVRSPKKNDPKDNEHEGTIPLSPIDGPPPTLLDEEEAKKRKNPRTSSSSRSSPSKPRARAKSKSPSTRNHAPPTRVSSRGANSRARGNPDVPAACPTSEVDEVDRQARAIADHVFAHRRPTPYGTVAKHKPVYADAIRRGWTPEQVQAAAMSDITITDRAIEVALSRQKAETERRAAQGIHEPPPRPLYAGPVGDTRTPEEREEARAFSRAWKAAGRPVPFHYEPQGAAS